MPKFLLFKLLKPKKGFTLIELMISVAILAVISSIGFVSYGHSQVLGRDARRKQDIRSLSTALELFYQTNKIYPCTGTAAPWVNSTQSQSTLWLVDRNSSASPCTGTGASIAPTYIGSMPTDPANSATYNYQYYSTGADWNTCKGGKYYILYTTLENTNDSERYGANPYSACGLTPAQLNFLSTAATYPIIGGNY